MNQNNNIEAKNTHSARDILAKQNIMFYQVIAKLIMSIIILVTCLYILFFKAGTSEEQKIAAAMMGVVIGYWIR